MGEAPRKRAFCLGKIDARRLDQFGRDAGDIEADDLDHLIGLGVDHRDGTADFGRHPVSASRYRFSGRFKR
jgi:hypothetical protein